MSTRSIYPVIFTKDEGEEESVNKFPSESRLKEKNCSNNAGRDNGTF